MIILPRFGKELEDAGILLMAYVEQGVVKSNRSIWRLRTIVDFFWAIINFIGVCFSTMLSNVGCACIRWKSQMPIEKDLVQAKKWDGGGPGGPGSRPYGGGGGGDGPGWPPRGLDNV